LIKVACVDCGTQSRSVLPCSPAAPILTALEALEGDGWTYTIGFTEMMTGMHNQRCPECSRRLMLWRVQKADGRVLSTFNHVPRYHEVPDGARVQSATKVGCGWRWADFVGPLQSIAR
jgi:DNA-directed RNA polymerase subunit RPC12/RpoP